MFALVWKARLVMALVRRPVSVLDLVLVPSWVPTMIFLKVPIVGEASQNVGLGHLRLGDGKSILI